MEAIVSALVPIAMLGVLAILGLGIYSLFRGGDFGRSNSNKLMRLRVLVQFIAVILLMILVYLRGG